VDLTLSRRSLLKGLGAGALVTLAGTGRVLTPRAFADLTLSGVRPLPDPRTSGLDHVVFLMMENRSYDHYLWWLPGGDGRNDLTYVDETGATRATEDWGARGRNDFHGCAAGDPHHGWGSSRHQLAHGFAADNPEYALSYYQPDDVPAIAGLARGFTAFDRYFCSVLGPTFPNRHYLVSATAGGNTGNCYSTSIEGCHNEDEAGDTDFSLLPGAGLDWATIFDRLTAAGVSWRVYMSDISAVMLFGERIIGSGNVFTIDQYYVDCAAGTLPHVAMVEPRFDNAYTGIGNDDHWPHDVRMGQQLISDTFTALAESRHWPNSAFVVTYDEHGGFFDHVRPPRTRDDRANGFDIDRDHGQLGFRVPTIVASPFARREFVGHATYDHTSILKMIEWRFRLAPLTRRDAAARNLAETFVWDAPDTSIPDTFAPYRAPVMKGPDGWSCGGEVMNPAAELGYSVTDANAGRDHDLSRLFEAGVFEAMGWRMPFETSSEVPTRVAREVVG
jgi:phospholipase C